MTRTAPSTGQMIIALVVAQAAALPLASVASAADPSPTVAECLSANENGLTLQHAQSFGAARKELQTCAAASCPAEVRAACSREVQRIDEEQPAIVFAVTTVKHETLTNVSVAIDGAPFLDHLDGSAQAVDPGKHTFVFTVPGQGISVERTYLIRAGEKMRREHVVVDVPGAASESPVPTTVAAVPGSSPAATAPPEEAAAADSSAPAASPANDGSGQRVAAYVIGGAGLVGIGLGAYFGLHSHSLWNSSQSECASTANCPMYGQAVTDHDSASTSAAISDVMFAVGGAAVVTSAVLLLVAPHGSGSSTTSTARASRPAFRWSPSVGPTSAGLQLGGTFQ